MAAAGVDEQKLLHILVSLSPPPSLPLSSSLSRSLSLSLPPSPSLPLSFRLSLSSFLSLSLLSLYVPLFILSLSLSHLTLPLERSISDCTAHHE